ncbi:MAG: hypothetical protein IH586_09165, partial [Anaerolineaceae bacterium]|nr:hypothetical protein [Anaerolineaceae bacterium]
MPDRIRNLPGKLPVPDVLKPKPTTTQTLKPGAPDVTQVLVEKTPTNAATMTGDVPTEEPGAPTSAPVSYTSVPDFLIYQDGLADGWQNWSWDTTTNLESTDPVFSGSKAISAQINKGWSAVYLHTDNPVSATRYTA